ncbi:MAG: hypothetical protein M1834_004645 [Cirrosporium novae-zelandiae]|nr:MAG: hypothetical protein M1834_004645 [Cirrosporium novae-zelandiae]
MFSIRKPNSRNPPGRSSSIRDWLRRLLPSGQADQKLPPKFKEKLDDLKLVDFLDDVTYNYYADQMVKWNVPKDSSLQDVGGLQRMFPNEHIEDEILPESGWECKKQLGTREDGRRKGGWGEAWLWENKNGMRIVVKDARFEPNFWKDYNIEGELTRRLNDAGCLNVIKVLDWQSYPHDNKIRTLYELAEHGDLEDLCRFYQREELILPEHFLIHLFHGMANALCFMEYGQNRTLQRKTGWEPIVHTDLKAPNIFLGAPSPETAFYPTIMLGDFGLAYQIPAHDPERKHVLRLKKTWHSGTMGYVAPERMPPAKGFPTSASDVWVVGRIMQNVVNQVLILYGLEDPTFYGDWEKGDAIAHEHFIYNDSLCELIMACTKDNPEDRPNAFNLVKRLEKLMTQVKAVMELAEQATRARHGRFHALWVLYDKSDQKIYKKNATFRHEYQKANLQMFQDSLADYNEAKAKAQEGSQGKRNQKPGNQKLGSQRPEGQKSQKQ